MNYDFLNVKMKLERVVLLPLSMDFRDDIFREFTSEVCVFMVPQYTGNIQDTDNFIIKSVDEMKERKSIQFAILKKDTREFLGCCGLRNINTSVIEPGIWIKKTAHGFGYGLEAVRGLKNWADANLKYDYLVYPVVKTNLKSRKIAETLGGKVVREMVKKNMKGGIMNEVEYEIDVNKY